MIEKAATPERTTPVTVRLRRLAAVPFVLCLLVFSAADHAASQAITLDKTGFEASAREFPACKIEAMDLHSSFAQKILHLSKSEPEIDIVQLDEMIYCVHIHDTKTSNTQSLVLIGYDFQLVIIPDIMYRGQLIPRISFTAGLFNHVVIAIANGKLVLTR